jgi:hypothetical protein
VAILVARPAGLPHHRPGRRGRLRATRKGQRRQGQWRLFPLITGLSIVEASLSVAVAAAGVAASSAFSGQLTTVLAQVAGALLPAMNATPGVGP